MADLQLQQAQQKVVELLGFKPEFESGTLFFDMDKTTLRLIDGDPDYDTVKDEYKGVGVTTQDYYRARFGEDNVILFECAFGIMNVDELKQMGRNLFGKIGEVFVETVFDMAEDIKNKPPEVRPGV